MPSTRAAYRNSCVSATQKTAELAAASCAWPRRNALRRAIAECMVLAHRITPELAAYHVSQMNLDELRRRAKLYAGMDLSAEGPKQSAADFYPVFGVATTTAGRSALNCTPPEVGCPFPMPESEAKNRVRGRRRFLPPQRFAVPESEEKTGKAEIAENVGLGERVFAVEVFT
jgi:hypothetical protein